MVWMHGASAGDIRALEPLMHELRDRRPDVNVSFTGFDAAGVVLGSSLSIPCWPLPADSKPYVSSWIRRRRPEVLVLERAEVWPNLIHCSANAGIRIIVVNARFRAKGWSALNAVFDQPLRRIDAFCAAAPRDRDRLLALGVSSDRIHVTGDSKRDRPLPDATHVARVRARLGTEGRRFWVSGSVHREEFLSVEQVARELKRIDPDLLWVLAPRHVDDAFRFERHLRRAGWRVNQYTILDTYGDLFAAYSGAVAAFVGGSLVPAGGHDVWEAAIQGTPVIYGPHHSDDSEAHSQPGVKAMNRHELANILRTWIRSPELRNRAGEQHRFSAQAMTGATARAFCQLESLL